MLAFALLFLIVAMTGEVGAQPAAFDIVLSTDAAPEGGLVQVSVFSNVPRALEEVSLAFTFDTGALPGALGQDCPAIEQAAAFAVTGDAAALVYRPFQMCGLIAVLDSRLGGIGRSSALPVFSFSVAPGEGLTVEIRSAAGSIASATVAPGGTLSVDRVRKLGETVEIEGHGFDPDAVVHPEGFAIANAQVASPRLIRAQLRGPVDLTGKRVRVTNPGGRAASYWIAPQSRLFDGGEVLLTFPVGASHRGRCGPEPSHPGYSNPNFLALRNPNSRPANVEISDVISFGSPEPAVVVVEIPAGETHTVILDDPPDSHFTTDPSTPLQALCFARTGANDFSFLSWWPVSLDSPLPTLGWLGSGASFVQGAAAPGEIVTLFGDFGPLNDDVRVLFNGETAPVLFSSDRQINAVVPYSVEAPVAEAQVRTGRGDSAVWSAPVRSASPALFVILGNGRGQAAALNEDGSLNDASNPALSGSVIQLFGTGQGRTVPATTAGEIAGDNPIFPLLPVRVWIGGVEATVQYAGSSTGSITGLLQVNAVIPAAAGRGTGIPVVLEIDGFRSSSGVTIAVQ